MNQILVTDRLYVTNKLKKKKRMYKFQFIASIILVFIFSGWYIYSEIEKNSAEAVSKDILSEITIENNDNDETISDEPLIVAMDDTEIIENEEPKQILNGTYTNENGNTYNYESILSIPCLGIEYPVLSETSEELLKISINKFWGGSPNSVGNYCVVGHNYKSGKMFGKLSQIKNGDIIKLTDLSGSTLNYKVYNKYVVYPEDVACTSQITNGLKEMTLITCTNGGKQRLIVKCREA
ncbi:MAG: sortase [Clostridia bacterium]|nr:sortase [Clostridia bacterium]